MAEASFSKLSGGAEAPLTAAESVSKNTADLMEQRASVMLDAVP